MSPRQHAVEPAVDVVGGERMSGLIGGRRDRWSRKFGANDRRRQRRWSGLRDRDGQGADSENRSDECNRFAHLFPLFSSELPIGGISPYDAHGSLMEP
jgi:hypothetical protein